MKSTFLFPLRLLAFWLLFFAAFRLWFVGWFHTEWSPEEPVSIWAAFWHALPLDLSMAAYLITVPVLLWFIGLAVGPRGHQTFSAIIFWFNVLLFSILVFIFGANVFIYEEWHTPLNNRALEYFKTPAALLDSMSFMFKVGCVAIYALAVWGCTWLYRQLVGRQVYQAAPSRWGLLALPVWLVLLALGIRGGVGVMPINESAVYYSPYLFDNHAATNSGWYFLHSFMEARSTVNHYHSMSQEEAEPRVKALFGAGIADGDLEFDWFQRPDSSRLNVVFIIMESMTAQVVEELEGEKGICPNLSRLIREGILFENCYGSGYRTDQGIVSVLGGYPAQPDQSVILLTDKAAKLNSVPKALHQHGYSTAFFYGGELTFANIGVWLRNQQFEKIISESDFSAAEKTQRWGVDDGILLQRAVRDIGQLKPPFFATAMTLSLHPPYDVPYQSKWQGSSDREKFLNSAAFADHSLGEFFKTAEQQSWYANTLFVLVADHGVSPPNGFGLDNPKARRIPLILFGQPLTKGLQGQRIDVFANHHDIPATILSMLKYQDFMDFYWSRDLLCWWRWSSDPSIKKRIDSRNQSGFAYYTNENGIGWINHQGAGFYQFQDKTWQMFQGQLDSASQKDAKAYLQILYEDFLRL